MKDSWNPPHNYSKEASVDHQTVVLEVFFSLKEREDEVYDGRVWKLGDQWFHQYCFR